GPLLLHQSGTYDVGHAGLLSSARKRPSSTCRGTRSPPAWRSFRAGSRAGRQATANWQSSQNAVCQFIAARWARLRQAVCASGGAGEDGRLLGAAQAGGQGAGGGQYLAVGRVQRAGGPVGAEHQAVWTEIVQCEIVVRLDVRAGA